jgi:hypothetical protein
MRILTQVLSRESSDNSSFDSLISIVGMLPGVKRYTDESVITLAIETLVRIIQGQVYGVTVKQAQLQRALNVLPKFGDAAKKVIPALEDELILLQAKSNADDSKKIDWINEAIEKIQEEEFHPPTRQPRIAK